MDGVGDVVVAPPVLGKPAVVAELVRMPEPEGGERCFFSVTSTAQRQVPDGSVIVSVST